MLVLELHRIDYSSPEGCFCLQEGININGKSDSSEFWCFSSLDMHQMRASWPCILYGSHFRPRCTQFLTDTSDKMHTKITEKEHDLFRLL